MEFGDALKVLADPYRRQLLLKLLADNPENEADIPAVMADDDGEFEDLFIKMYHQHLPALEGANVIEWDREENLVRKGPAFEELVPLLVLIRDHQDELPDGWL